MKKELTFYSVLLVIGLALAYYATLPRQDSESEEFSIINLDPDAVAKIEYQSPSQQVTLDLDTATKGFWVDETETLMIPQAGDQNKGKDPTKNKEAKAVEDPKPSDKAIEKKVERHYRASREIKNYLSLFKPLQGQRNLGELTDSNRKDFGLDKPRILKVTSQGGQIFELQLGSKNFGGTNYFAYVPDKKILTLVDSEVNNVIERAKDRLFERSVTSEALSEYDQALLKRGDKKKLIKKVRNDKNNTYSWLDEKQAKETGSLSYEAWLENFERLRIEEYADKAIAQATEQLTPVFELALTKGSQSDELKIYKMKDISPKESASGVKDGEDYFWLKSSFNNAVVRVSKTKMAAISSDFDRIIKD